MKKENMLKYDILSSTELITKKKKSVTVNSHGLLLSMDFSTHIVISKKQS